MIVFWFGKKRGLCWNLHPHFIRENPTVSSMVSPKNPKQQNKMFLPLSLLYVSIFLNWPGCPMFSILTKMHFHFVLLSLFFFYVCLFFLWFHIPIVTEVFQLVFSCLCSLWTCCNNATNNLTSKKQKVCSFCYQHAETRRRKGRTSQMFHVWSYDQGECSNNATNNLTSKKQKVCSLCYRCAETRRRKGRKRCDLFYGGERDKPAWSGEIWWAY